MQHALVIAEKPDLARKIEESYRRHRSDIPYEITVLSQRGHLLQTMMPDELDESLKKWSWDTIPIYPEDYGGWKYKVIKEKKVGNYQTSAERYKAIKTALHSGKYDFVIHAGDPDQEGELLVNMVLTQAKNKLPVKRFWTNDVTDTAIFHELQHLHDDEHDPMMTNLLTAAYSRQHWDWLFGVNVSRAASIKMNGRIACGRVKTTLLAIVVQREKEIAEFEPKTVYGVQADYQKGFSGTMFNAADQTDSEYADADQKAGVVWFNSRKEASDQIAQLGKKAVVTSVEKKHVSTYAPKLFKLSTLQVAAGHKGIDDAETLNTIQNLYEQTALSYPRTDCEYLSSKEDFQGILNAVAQSIPEYKPVIDKITAEDIERVKKNKRWINDAALNESGHSALRPTTTVVDLNNLSETAKYIYQIICQRFVGMFLPPLEQDATQIVAEADGRTFKSSGKITTSPGYTDFFDTQSADTELPPVEKGEVLDVADYEITTKTSTRPKRFTSSELIGVCENPARFLNDQKLRTLGKRLKIGTPATRSGIIKALSTPADKRTQDGKRGDGYLKTVKEGKREVLMPTPSGTAIIDNLNGLMITRVDMTGLWEERLDNVRKGQMTSALLDSEMKTDLNNMLEEIKEHKMTMVNNQSASGGMHRTSTEAGVACPVCGKPMMKGQWGWYCSGHRDNSCNFHIGYEISGAKLTDDDIKELITKKKTSKVFDMTSRRTGKSFKASLSLEDGGDLKFNFDHSGGFGHSIGTCPVCGKPLYENSRSYYCSGYKDGCSFSIWKSSFGHTLTEKEIQKLLKGETIGPVNDLRRWNPADRKFNGDKYSAKLYLDDSGKVQTTFD